MGDALHTRHYIAPHRYHEDPSAGTVPPGYRPVTIAGLLQCCERRILSSIWMNSWPLISMHPCVLFVCEMARGRLWPLAVPNGSAHVPGVRGQLRMPTQHLSHTCHQVARSHTLHQVISPAMPKKKRNSVDQHYQRHNRRIQLFSEMSQLWASERAAHRVELPLPKRDCRTRPGIPGQRPPPDMAPTRRRKLVTLEDLWGMAHT